VSQFTVSNLSHSPESPPTITYRDLCHQIKVGDVLTFSGTDIPSGVVKLATQSPYVHVAIAHTVDPDAPPTQSILIAESHIDISLPSVGTGKRILGVQFQWLAHRLAHHPGQVWWVPLKTPLTPLQIAEMQVWLQTIESQQIPYDFIQAIAAGVTRRNTADYSSLFCSELVTRALQIAGVVNETINPSQQVPADVMQFPCFQSPQLIIGKP
jgi:hypothetical protein